MKPERVNNYAPLRSYALIGDMRGTALVSTDGRIDWLAAPTMDSYPLCAAILDADGGGTIELAPTIDYEVERRYRPETLVLETTFVTARGRVRVVDCMNLGTIGLLPWTELVRVVECESGDVPMAWRVEPRHPLGPSRPWTFHRAGIPMAMVGEEHLALVVDGVGGPSLDGHAATGSFVAEPGAPAILGIVVTRGEPVFVPGARELRQRVECTGDRWRHWSSRVDYNGPWREAVLRSALSVKALTLQPTGGIAAAATTSLPERIGGTRNFDYRFAWIRDASFALDAVVRLGLSEETHAGIAWLRGVAAKDAPDLRVFYSLGGDAVPADMQEVEGMSGYRGSSPVHLGNSAASQLQLGSYGDLMSAVGSYTVHGGRLDARTAQLVGSLADHTCAIWQSKDAGLWELGDQQRYTTSKIGSWTALNWAIRLAESGQVASLNVERWRMERDDIRAWTDEHCWSTTKQSYTFYAGTEDLDCGTLLAARTGFCSGDDPRLHTTIDAIRRELTAEGPLLYRYSGMQSEEGAFLACTCWLVEALVHVGRLDEACTVFEGFVERANDVGLFSEEMDPLTGELLGNVPQALTHLAVINAATALSAAMG